jgi:hypothetical protein
MKYSASKAISDQLSRDQLLGKQVIRELDNHAPLPSSWEMNGKVTFGCSIL